MTIKELIAELKGWSPTTKIGVQCRDNDNNLLEGFNEEPCFMLNHDKDGNLIILL